MVAILRNGDGPVVAMRGDTDGLPMAERSGVDYAAEGVTQVGEASGQAIPVAHTCGHDFHIVCLLGATQALHDHRDDWSGTFVAVFQPGEENAAGAKAMVAAGIVDKLPRPDVYLGQHMLGSLPGGAVGIRSGPLFSAAASGTKSNIIPESAVLQLNTRAFDKDVEKHLHEAIERIVHAECGAARSPKPPEFRYYDQYPLTSNHEEPTVRVRAAFDAYFGDDSVDMSPVPASEDFSVIPDAFGCPYTYWGLGGFEDWKNATGNHSPFFAPDIHPTLDRGTEAIVVAASPWLIGSK
ncbi:M20/M25/M40 family metallo-hydrolase [Luteimonas sp. MJ250]|uniref:M20/M25/M40 family metallo-hydrolase n=1 Tax=Luteimonas sp. MJ250 TaxID=3129236 RepID=UPI0031BA2908